MTVRIHVLIANVKIVCRISLQIRINYRPDHKTLIFCEINCNILHIYLSYWTSKSVTRIENETVCLWLWLPIRLCVTKLCVSEVWNNSSLHWKVKGPWFLHTDFTSLLSYLLHSIIIFVLSCFCFSYRGVKRWPSVMSLLWLFSYVVFCIPASEEPKSLY